VTAGLFGSSFDPPHDGHVALVEAARRELGLEPVVILVTVRPAYKRVETPVETRLELARAAFPGCPIEREESTSDVTVREAEARFGDVVFLIGAADNQFPTRRSIESGDVEEERRLFYVAVTRAKNELYLSYPRVATRAGPGGMLLQPSRFLTELPEELYEQITIKRSSGW